MDNAYLPLIIGPLALSLVILAINAWRDEQRRRRERLEQLRREAELAQRAKRLTEARIPDGCMFICHDGIPREHANSLPGPLMLVGVGSYGVAQLLRLLLTLFEYGLADFVGGIFAVESDAILRSEFIAKLPAIYHDRLTLGFAEAYPGGLSNRDVAEVKSYIKRWGPGLQDAAVKATKLFLRRNAHPPGEILPFIGLGGHGLLGVVALSAIHAAFPEVQLIGCCDLPVDEPLREHWLDLRDLFAQSGVFGWLFSDSLSRDTVSADSAMIDLLTGLAVASLQPDRGIRINNVFTRTQANESGGICSYDFAYGDTVAHPYQPDTEHAPRYYVNAEQLTNTALILLERIEAGQGTAALEMPAKHERTSTYDLILAPLAPHDIRTLRDRIEAARTLDADHRDPHTPTTSRFKEPNYHTVVVSWAPAIDSAEPLAQLAVIRLHAIAVTPATLPELVKAPVKRSFSPRRRRSTLTSLPRTTNGVAPVPAPGDER